MASLPLADGESSGEPQLAWLLSLKRLQGVNYRGDLVVAQVWADWDAEHRIGQLFRDRKIATFPATVGVGSGQVGRHRIMDECANTGLLQIFLQFIT